VGRRERRQAPYRSRRKAYLAYLYTPQAQRLACKWGYRPRLTRWLGSCGTSFARTDLTRLPTSAVERRQREFFADGGVFDQVYQSSDSWTRGLALGMTMTIVRSSSLFR